MCLWLQREPRQKAYWSQPRACASIGLKWTWSEGMLISSGHISNGGTGVKIKCPRCSFLRDGFWKTSPLSLSETSAEAAPCSITVYSSPSLGWSTERKGSMGDGVEPAPAWYWVINPWLGKSLTLKGWLRNPEEWQAQISLLATWDMLWKPEHFNDLI